jgi:hypothetical protein
LPRASAAGPGRRPQALRRRADKSHLKTAL